MISNEKFLSSFKDLKKTVNNETMCIPKFNVQFEGIPEAH
jgi:hypothetical protein